MPPEERSAAARRLAEIALVNLSEAMATSSIQLVVLGGLIPETLAGLGGPAHLGTTDIDVLVAVHIGDVDDASAVEHALDAVAAYPDETTPDGWRWRIPVGSTRVKIEFLCDDTTRPNREAIALPGCNRLSALNLRGTGYVARDYSERQMTAGDTRVTVRMAGLQGYLLAKAHAVRDRGADKDYYDFAYVLLHNSQGGPVQASERLLAGPFAAEIPILRTIWLEVNARFQGPSSIGAQAYARQALLANPNASEPLLRNDAYAAVAEFLQALEILG